MTAIIVKSAERVLRLFELFATERTPLTAAEISRRLVWPKSSANVLLRSLAALGYLNLDESSLEYFPSPRLSGLGDWIPDSLVAGEDALRLLSELRDRTGETVTLSVQNGFAMQFVFVLPGACPISLAFREGYTAPIFGSAVGLAFLSAQPDDGIRRLTHRVNHRVHHGPQIGISQLLADVRVARERGYAVAYESLFADTGAIAYPLQSRCAGRTVVVGVGGGATRIRRSEARLMEAMRTTFGHAPIPLLGPARAPPPLGNRAH